MLFSVGPHPDDPDPSRINENLREGLYGQARVRSPAVRKSYLENGPLAADRRRGEGTFIEVDWDRALDLVAAEMTRVQETYGANAIFGGSYGWSSAGRFHHAQSQLKRFLTAAAGFVRSEGNYSYNAALVLMPHIVGNFRRHVKEATRWSTVAKEGRLVVMFGDIIHFEDPGPEALFPPGLLRRPGGEPLAGPKWHGRALFGNHRWLRL